MTRAPLRSLSAALLLALTGALTAACAGEEAPAASAPETSQPASAAVEASPSPGASDAASDAAVAKPARPAAMEKMDAEGAAAAAEYFLSLDRYMMVTGDTSEWERMSHQSCQYCAARLEQAHAIAERGDSFRGGAATTIVSTVFEQDPVTGIWPLNIVIREDATSIIDATGTEVFSSAAAQAERRAEMGRVDNEWVVVEIAPIPED